MQRNTHRLVVKLDNLRDFDKFDLHDLVRSNPAKVIPAMEKALNELVRTTNWGWSQFLCPLLRLFAPH